MESNSEKRLSIAELVEKLTPFGETEGGMIPVTVVSDGQLEAEVDDVVFDDGTVFIYVKVYVDEGGRRVTSSG